MSFELQTVVWTTLILFVLLMFQGSLIAVTQGVKWDVGNRDSAKQKSALQGRADRTVTNHIEGMLLFVPLVIVADQMNISNSLTVWGAGLYLTGRLAYVPLYLIGVPIVRTLSWTVATTGIGLVGYEVFRAFI